MNRDRNIDRRGDRYEAGHGGRRDNNRNENGPAEAELFSSPGHINLDGGHDSDRRSGGYGNEYTGGNAGSDRRSGGYGNEYTGGNAGSDRRSGGYGSEYTGSNAGSDRRSGGYGNEYTGSNAGSDRRSGGYGNQYTGGNAESDRRSGGYGSEYTGGNAGSDRRSGGYGSEYLSSNARHERSAISRAVSGRTQGRPDSGGNKANSHTPDDRNDERRKGDGDLADGYVRDSGFIGSASTSSPYSAYTSSRNEFWAKHPYGAYLDDISNAGKAGAGKTGEARRANGAADSVDRNGNDASVNGMHKKSSGRKESSLKYLNKKLPNKKRSGKSSKGMPAHGGRKRSARKDELDTTFTQSARGISHEERRRRQNRRDVVQVLVAFAIVAVIIALGFFIYDLTLVSEITITGSTTFSQAQILSLSGIQKGENIFLYNLDELTARIDAIPELSTVSMRRVFPNRIEIEVADHDAYSAILAANGTYTLIDVDGFVLSIGQNDSRGLLVIDGLSSMGFAPNTYINDESLNVRVDTALKLIRALSQSGLDGHALGIDVTNSAYIKLELKNGFTVILGEFDHAAENIATAEKAYALFLPDYPDGGTINVFSGSTIVDFTPNVPSNATTAPSDSPSVSYDPNGDVPVSTAPISDAPVSDTPVSDTPVSDAPASDAPASDIPASDAPVTSVPASVAPVTDIPASAAPVTGVPTSVAPVTDIPTPTNDGLN